MGKKVDGISKGISAVVLHKRFKILFSAQKADGNNTLIKFDNPEEVMEGGEMR